MSDWCRRVAESPAFQSFITAVILANAVIVGLETSAPLLRAYGQFFHALNAAIMALFVVEIALRIGAHGGRPASFFRDGWNVFDFAVVSTSLLPEAGSFATVARLARLLRVTRLVSMHPELRLIVGTMVRSIPSMGHVILLLSLLLYVYGVIGFHLFVRADPEHWGTLGSALLTLFQILTLEGWVEIQTASMAAWPLAWVYFASFIVVAVFVVINLFVAVVLNNLDAAKAEQLAAADAANPQHHLLQRIEALKLELDHLERDLRRGSHADDGTTVPAPPSPLWSHESQAP